MALARGSSRALVAHRWCCKTPKTSVQSSPRLHQTPLCSLFPQQLPVLPWHSQLANRRNGGSCPALALQENHCVAPWKPHLEKSSCCLLEGKSINHHHSNARLRVSNVPTAASSALPPAGLMPASQGLWQTLWSPLVCWRMRAAEQEELISGHIS